MLFIQKNIDIGGRGIILLKRMSLDWWVFISCLSHWEVGVVCVCYSNELRKGKM